LKQFREWEKERRTSSAKQRTNVALPRKGFLSVPVQAFKLLWTDNYNQGIAYLLTQKPAWWPHENHPEQIPHQIIVDDQEKLKVVGIE